MNTHATVRMIRASLKKLGLALAAGAATVIGLGQPVNAASPVTSGLVLHLDASASSTMTVDGSNTVSEWRDLQGSAAKMTLRGGTPTLVASGIGSVPTVHFDSSSWMNEIGRASCRERV